LPFGVEAELNVYAQKVSEKDANTAELHIASRATGLTTP
jgi:hypothetical protein